MFGSLTILGNEFAWDHGLIIRVHEHAMQLQYFNVKIYLD